MLTREEIDDIIEDFDAVALYDTGYEVEEGQAERETEETKALAHEILDLRYAEEMESLESLNEWEEERFRETVEDVIREAWHLVQCG